MDDIRQLVVTTLKGLGYGTPTALGEGLVCCEQHYVGVRFAFEGVSAIWLSEAGHVRFVDDTGKLLKVVRQRPARQVEQVA